MPKPTVGRIVHYVPLASFYTTPLAAMVISVIPSGVDNLEVLAEHNYSVLLRILTPIGDFNLESPPFSAKPKPGCWSWPPIERGE